MKLLFVHGTKMKEDEYGNLYTSGSFSEEIWERYLKLSKDLTVLARKENTTYNFDQAQEKFNFFNKEKINFVEVTNITSSVSNFFSISQRNKIHDAIKKEVEKSDFVIARLPSTFGKIAVKFAKKLNKPYLVEVVGCIRDTFWNHSMKGKILSVPEFICMRKAVKSAPYVVYVTNEFLQKRYPTTGKHINCSNVTLSEYDRDALNKRLQKIDQLKKSSKIIIGTTAGINVKYKGQQFIIEALGILKSQGITNYEYQLVGDGDPSYLKKIAKELSVEDQLKILGSKQHDEVIKWLDGIDIYAQPSLTEGLPRALIEAMSRSLPSIGSDAGGIPELLQEEYNVKDIANNTNKLSELLLSFNQSTMKEQAIINFEESKRYDKNIIETRRQAFFKEFKEEAKKY